MKNSARSSQFVKSSHVVCQSGVLNIPATVLRTVLRNCPGEYQYLAVLLIGKGLAQSFRQSLCGWTRSGVEPATMPSPSAQILTTTISIYFSDPKDGPI